jgi:hypothetical protein
MTRGALPATGAAAGVSPLAFPAPAGTQGLVGLTLLVLLLALAAGALTARAAADRLDDGTRRIPVTAGLLLLGVAVPCPRPQAAAATLTVLAVCAFATAMVAVSLLRPLLRPAPAGLGPITAHATAFVAAAAAGCAAGSLCLAEARGGASVLVCTAGLLHLARSTASTRSTS